MPRGKSWRKGGQNACIGEELRIALHMAMKKFRTTEEQKELEFPSSLTSEERAYIHRMAAELGLKSKSRGKGSSRFLTVYKREGSTIVQSDAVVQLSRQSRHHVFALLQKFPVSSKERQDLLPLTERDRLLGIEIKDASRSMGRLTNGIPQVPPKRGNSELQAFRESLPIWPMREEIITLMNNNSVVIIAGETGSGKTTQVPQFILEQCCEHKKACRIVCTQPRRLAALSLAERVACEREERVGQMVGYQIRLESRVSPKTLLTFCTHGVLLRTLMGGMEGIVPGTGGGGSVLGSITHLILDEIHERSRHADFLLAVLREQMPKFRGVKLVVMSAAMDTELFQKYFHGCPLLTVPGRMFNVREVFLEDILRTTSYMSDSMKKLKAQAEKKKSQQKQLVAWTTQSQETAQNDLHENPEGQCAVPILGAKTDMGMEKTELEPWLAEQMDHCIQETWLTGLEDAFTQLIHLILAENVSVDYQHTETSATPLMVAAGRGNTNVAEQLLNLGASLTIRASNDWTALDWARHMKKDETALLIEAYMKTFEMNDSDSQDLAILSEDKELTEEEKELLDLYHHSFNDEKVDIDLIMWLLHHIHGSREEGAILVFLPGYDDIVGLRERIINDDKRLNDRSKYVLYTLHSHMQSSDQKRVFRPLPHGTRKIILATNIAETSITINEIVFVIDSGKVKENCFDALTSVSMLRTGWVSQASAIQRKGRAGRLRDGICYRLFSRIRYRSLQEYQTPEILRTPLQELCLYTKSLAPPNTPIAEFLAKVPEPPAPIVTRNAVQHLKMIDALDPWEDLTELGHHLLDLPVEPRLGKMLLYAVVLKCLDPVLTIVCCISYRDPFLLPSQPSQKVALNQRRKKFAAGAFSDHMALLRVFQMWQKARSDGWDKSFCESNFVSSATMDMIVSMRTHLLGQLRASGLVRTRGGGDIRDLNTNSENWSIVKAALCAGMYPNIVRVDRDHMQLRTKKESKVRLHPSSTLLDCSKSPRMTVATAHSKALEGLPTEWILYDEMTRTGHVAHVQRCTIITGVTLLIFGGPMRLALDAVSQGEGSGGGGAGDHAHQSSEADSDSGAEERPEGDWSSFKLDEWVLFRMSGESAQVALQLRQKWHSLFLRRLRAPSRPPSPMDEMVVQAIATVLATEEQKAGLIQPTGIGQRPKLPATDFMSSMPLELCRISGDTETCDDMSVTSDKYSSPRAMATGERADSGSIKSYGSVQPSPTASPTPSVISSVDLGAQSSNSGDASMNLHSNARYFVIKASSHKAVEASYAQGYWSFTLATERRLVRMLKEQRTVVLVFSVHGSGHFQGYARLLGDLSRENMNEPPLAPHLSPPYRLEWLRKGNLPFQLTRHLQNPYNETRRVQISRDGQELEPGVGEALCRLWDKHLAPLPRHSSHPNPHPHLHPQPHPHTQHYRPSRPQHHHPNFFGPTGGAHFNQMHPRTPPPMVPPPHGPPHNPHHHPQYEGRPIRGINYRGRGGAEGYGGGGAGGAGGYMQYGYGYVPRGMHGK